MRANNLLLRAFRSLAQLVRVPARRGSKHRPEARSRRCLAGRRETLWQQQPPPLPPRRQSAGQAALGNVACEQPEAANGAGEHAPGQPSANGSDAGAAGGEGGGADHRGGAEAEAEEEAEAAFEGAARLSVPAVRKQGLRRTPGALLVSQAGALLFARDGGRAGVAALLVGGREDVLQALPMADGGLALRTCGGQMFIFEYTGACWASEHRPCGVPGRAAWALQWRGSRGAKRR